jgi:hypothetical protein
MTTPMTTRPEAESAKRDPETGENRMLRDLARVGFDAAVTIHDLSNIIGAAAGYAQLAAMGTEVADIKEALDVAVPALGRARDALTRFKHAVNTIRPPEPTSVDALIDRATAVLREDFHVSGWVFSVTGDVRERVLAPVDDVVWIVRCLLLHLAEIGVEPGELRIRIYRSDSRVTLAFDAPGRATSSNAATAFRFRDWVRQRALLAGGKWTAEVDDAGSPVFQLALPSL